ncbi:SMI1/KNR4 family protein [Nocardioides luteus]|uniref:SMI1/KNR4 family protein n=1 Tax=Nocardioides luteus TaxID=1844 RepID=UPI00210E4FA6|nr:SMI1/KNR4 family protein [Nocardioides luteus]
MQQHAALNDDEGLIQSVPPSPGAPKRDLEAVSSRFGIRLDAPFLEFLKEANGWPWFLYDLRIVSARELLSERFVQDARDLIFVEQDLIEDALGVNAIDCLPIGISESSTDCILLLLDGSGRPGEVIWEDNGEIYARHKDFEEFFRWMTRYQAGEVKL